MDGLEDCLLVGLCGSAIGRVGAAPANASSAEGMSATSVTFRKVILISIRTAQLDSQASTTRTSKNQSKQQFSTPKVVKQSKNLMTLDVLLSMCDLRCSQLISSALSKYDLSGDLNLKCVYVLGLLFGTFTKKQCRPLKGSISRGTASRAAVMAP